MSDDRALNDGEQDPQEQQPRERDRPRRPVRRRLVMPAWQVVGFVALAFVIGHYSGRGAVPAPVDNPHAAAPTTTTTTATDERVAEMLGRLDDPDQLVEIGNAHFDRDKFRIAALSYERALELGLDTADVRTDLGVCYRRLGEPERAIEQFRRAAASDPSHAESRYNLGVVFFHDLQDEAGARAAWEDFLNVVPPDDSRAEKVRQNLEALGQPEAE